MIELDFGIKKDTETITEKISKIDITKDIEII